MGGTVLSACMVTGLLLRYSATSDPHNSSSASLSKRSTETLQKILSILLDASGSGFQYSLVFHCKDDWRRKVAARYWKIYVCPLCKDFKKHYRYTDWQLNKRRDILDKMNCIPKFLPILQTKWWSGWAKCLLFSFIPSVYFYTHLYFLFLENLQWQSFS